MKGEHRTLVCPECGRVSSVAEWVKRPICVHAWDNGTPEIWDGAAEGDHIEDSLNEKYRTPGPDTWTDMVPGAGREGEMSELEEGVILAAIDLVESETAPPLVGVPSRDQPWTQARARLATAVEAYRNAETVAKKER